MVDDRVRHLRFGAVTCPLVKPYDLSFASLSAFDSVWVAAEFEDGRIGIGEAVALPGYGWETFETIRETVGVLTAGADGLSRSAIVARCRDVQIKNPFAASAVVTAVEMPEFVGHVDLSCQFAVSAPVAADWPLPELGRALEIQLAAGYEFIKVKVGRDYDKDVEGMRFILGARPGRNFHVVFDANQAYSIDVALGFARELRNCSNNRLQWFEQPVDRENWDDMERLCQSGDTPIVLDECIYTEADVTRAAKVGARGIKLKLMKNFGITETLSLARKARASGLFVVFGNGVATDIGNLGEYLVLASGQGLFEPPSEANGFAKLQEPLLGPILRIGQGGRLCCFEAGTNIEARLRKFSQRSG